MGGISSTVIPGRVEGALGALGHDGRGIGAFSWF